MKSLSTKELARFSARRPWLVVLVWVALLVGAGYLAMGVGDVLTTEESLGVDLESKRAEKLIDERFGRPEQASEQIIIRSERLTVDDGAYEAFVANALAQVRALDTVQVATSFYETRVERLVSPDRHTTIIAAVLKGDEDDAEEHSGPVVGLVERLNGRQGFEVLTAGDGSIDRAFTDTSERDLKTAEFIGLPVALLVLVVVFGALAAAGVPIVLALLSIAVAVGVTALLGRAFDLSMYVINMITMIGLAVGIDYSLFIVERYREERRRGVPKQDAIAAAGATSGKAVLFSGLTVVVALCGLLIVPTSIFRSLAAGAIIVALVAVAAALTLLPATLALAGDRVNALRLPFMRRRGGHEYEGGLWGRLADLVMRRPVASVIVSTALLVAAAAPYFSIELGQSGVSSLPRNVDAFRGFQILEREFSAGIIAPTKITVDAADVNAPEVQQAVARLRERLAADDAFGPSSVETNDARTLSVISVPTTGDPQENASLAAVSRLRDEYIPEAFAGSGAEALVTGPTAFTSDFSGMIDRYTPYVFAFVLGLSFVLLLVLFRSIVVPVKAMIMNLLSVGAAYGLIVLVFQHGIGSGLLGFQRVERIEAWVPLFLFAVLFGLSMDYHVFLLSRIRERFDQTRDNRGAVSFGLRSTAGIITGAALIMVAVFVGFAMGDLVSFQQMGFGLAVAVALDATIVRSVLVPASMVLLGDLNWYLPHWLRWLPDIRVEGTRPSPAGAVAAHAVSGALE